MYERFETECYTSCRNCDHKCEDYINELEFKEIEELMQGTDRIPMKKVHGAYRNK